MTDNEKEIRELFKVMYECDEYIRSYKQAKHTVLFRKNYNYLERIRIKKLAKACRWSKISTRNKLIELFRCDNESTEVVNVLEIP